MKRIWLVILDWLFPFYCSGCEGEGETICAECLGKVPLIENQVCPICRKVSQLGRVCEICKVEERNLEGLFVAYDYVKGGTLSKALHNLKYECQVDYGVVLSKMLGKRIENLKRGNFDYISWVPLSKKRFKQRGFNQGEILAKEVLLEITKVEFLEKVRETKAQMTLDKRQRELNLKSAFMLKEGWKDRFIGKKILLIDDVATTLSTLREAAAVLKLAGAEKVYAAVLARQQH